MGATTTYNIQKSGVRKLNLGNNLSSSEKISSGLNKSSLFLRGINRALEGRDRVKGPDKQIELNKDATSISSYRTVRNIIMYELTIEHKEVPELVDVSNRILICARNVEKNAPTTELGELRQAVRNLSKEILLLNETARTFQPNTESLHNETARILLGLNFKYKLGLEDELLTDLSVTAQTAPKYYGAVPSKSASSTDGAIFNPVSDRNDMAAAVDIIEDVIQKCDAAEKRARSDEIAMRINDEKKEAEKQYYKLLERKKAEIRQQKT